MKRRRGAGASGPEGDAPLRPFEVEAKSGHAWFARPGKQRKTVERRATKVPVLRKAELVLAGQARAIARRPLRIPADSIISVAGPGLRLALAQPAEAAAPREGANDNVSEEQRLPGWLREVLFLMIFVATLAGTYYLGRQHGAQNVIIVPETAHGTHRIT